MLKATLCPDRSAPFWKSLPYLGQIATGAPSEIKTVIEGCCIRTAGLANLLASMLCTQPADRPGADSILSTLADIRSAVQASPAVHRGGAAVESAVESQATEHPSTSSSQSVSRAARTDEAGYSEDDSTATATLRRQPSVVRTG